MFGFGMVGNFGFGMVGKFGFGMVGMFGFGMVGNFGIFLTAAELMAFKLLPRARQGVAVVA